MSDEKDTEPIVSEGDKLRAFTFKSLSFSLFAIIFINILAPFNDNVTRMTLAVGNHFPVIGILILFAMAFFWNGIWERLWKPLVLNSKEMTVVMVTSFASCWVPTSGLYRYFLKFLIMPWYYAPNESLWKKYEVMSYLPEKLFPLGNELGQSLNDLEKLHGLPLTKEGGDAIVNTVYEHPMYNEVYQGFVNGDNAQQIGDMPWAEWMSVFSYWIPIIIVFGILISALSLMVHRQWAHHEQLSYPLATVAGKLLERDETNSRSVLFSDRLFWVGFSIVFIIYVFQYLGTAYSSSFPYFNFHTNFRSALYHVFDSLSLSGIHGIDRGSVYFTVIGCAFFTAPVISLSLGLCQIVQTFIGAQWYSFTGRAMNSWGSGSSTQMG
ncbi:MAG: hypothetical protein HRT89_22590, partial [Lentisphaeria bacterium]|nr:hypothetical protein [Lentisphaeria bacterium]